VYCPLLPKKFSNDLLQCPTPFFVGVQREFLDLAEVPGDVVVLDLDQDSCSVTPDLQAALFAGKKLTKRLTALLAPALFCCDDLAPAAVETNSFAGNDMAVVSASSDCMVREVLRACKLFIGDLLVGLEECCTFGVDHDEAVVLFDEAMFLASRVARRKDPASMLSFLQTEGGQGGGHGVEGRDDDDDDGDDDGDAPPSEFLSQFLRTQCFSLCVIGTILKKLGPDSRPPSRPSSPYISIPSPTLLSLPLPLPPPLLPSGDRAASAATTSASTLLQHQQQHQLPTTPVQMS
jgi:hypothetical protein